MHFLEAVFCFCCVPFLLLQMKGGELLADGTVRPTLTYMQQIRALYQAGGMKAFYRGGLVSARSLPLPSPPFTISRRRLPVACPLPPPPPIWCA